MIERGVILPDIHVPRHEEKCVSAVFKFIKAYKPHFIIQLGDLIDFDSLSSYPARRKNHLVSLQDELDAGKEMFDRIEETLPRGCKKIYLEGNHEDRLERFDINSLGGKEKKLLGRSHLGDVAEEMELSRRGWHFTRYGGIYSKGKCCFMHGNYTNQFHAKKVVTKYFENIVYGHTHQYQVHAIVGRDRHPVTATSLGTLSRFDLPYVSGLTDWVHMFGVIEYYGNKGHFSLHPIPIINGQFSYGGTLYGKD